MQQMTDNRVVKKVLNGIQEEKKRRPGNRWMEDVEEDLHRLGVWQQHRTKTVSYTHLDVYKRQVHI